MFRCPDCPAIVCVTSYYLKIIKSQQLRYSWHVLQGSATAKRERMVSMHALSCLGYRVEGLGDCHMALMLLLAALCAGIQGPAMQFVRGIDGDFQNVMGLPVS